MTDNKNSAETAILWFRQDLRLQDNPALTHACANGYKIVPIYILDDESAQWKMGGASRWWLHHSLHSLNRDLDGHLNTYKGKAAEVLLDLVQKYKAHAVFWNRCYEPWRVERDKEIKSALTTRGIIAESFNASLLWEPWETRKSDGTAYKVFTPFYKNCTQNASPPRAPESKPNLINFYPQKPESRIEELGLIPEIPWYKPIESFWQVGESAAHHRLSDFLECGLKGYTELRNRPDLDNVSRLSPHLHFGEISVRTLWHRVRQHAVMHHLEKDADVFCTELGWREFSHTLLHDHPDLPEQPLNRKFRNYPWQENTDHYRAWTRGQTGIPIVDAGMRQLWQTGWMHNRIRMIVASLLVKNMGIPWQDGARWFWDTLVDADLANNSASWQWSAGCGADAAPYFRIFNPVTQGEKFDPNGDYVRAYVPELARLPSSHIHKPWEAPQAMLKQAGVILGKTYPLPVLDLKATRQKALDGYAQIK